MPKKKLKNKPNLAHHERRATENRDLQLWGMCFVLSLTARLSFVLSSSEHTKLLIKLNIAPSLQAFRTLT